MKEKPDEGFSFLYICPVWDGLLVNELFYATRDYDIHGWSCKRESRAGRIRGGTAGGHASERAFRGISMDHE